jgi:predicted LPLAT superfamily acyltransferase
MNKDQPDVKKDISGPESTGKNSPPKRRWDGRSQGPWLGNLIFMKLIAWGGLAPAYLLLKFVAYWYSRRDDKTMRVIASFYRQIGMIPLPDRIYRHVVAFGESLIDGYAFLYRRELPFTYLYEGEEHIQAALQQGNGLILLTAHIGNWEIAGNLLFDRLRTRVNFIMLDEEREPMRQIFSAAIDNRRIKIIPVSDDPLAMMVKVRKVLADNEILCIPGDRISGTEESRLLPFFGKNARFPAGPFVFGAITGAPIIAVFCVKQRRRRFLLKVYGSISFEGVKRETRNLVVDNAMREYVRILENIVRDYPDQWFNLYDFWE